MTWPYFSVPFFAANVSQDAPTLVPRTISSPTMIRIASAGEQEQPLLHPPVHPAAEDQQQREQDVQQRAEQEHVPLHVDAEEVVLASGRSPR